MRPWGGFLRRRQQTSAQPSEIKASWGPRRRSQRMASRLNWWSRAKIYVDDVAEYAQAMDAGVTA